VAVEYFTTEYSLHTEHGALPMAESDVISATGLALATIASLIERPEPVPAGEVARCLGLLAEAASPARPEQREILAQWARLLETARRTDPP